MRLSGAHVYDIDSNGSGSDVVPTRMISLCIFQPVRTRARIQRDPASTAHLRFSDSAADVAEFQWRQSTCVTSFCWACWACRCLERGLVNTGTPRWDRDSDLCRLLPALRVSSGLASRPERSAFPGRWIAPALSPSC